ncbi:glycosyltransferase involved in cell wall biosynthesis [Krasilnikovia cinnamomea]|uniref:Glycosyltransferase involved in cell wall biosynthesis n=1 Tax=Krasilnikovia cinnamomea TaxID=349313 RepID=A0A4Q7ZHH1_9ACTN|nr:glycosyltransferase [Krasilnikovia cinnamomea]RZU50272.1 glycosyltransferase involved in cell wall biosynthesis [Krasilnikovia cinnamomea]
MAEPRDIFIVCNSVNELGGLIQWAHDIGRLFSARGHRVRLVGVEPATVARDYGSDLPYPMITLHDDHLPRRRKVEGLSRLNVVNLARQRHRAKLLAEGAQRLTELFREAQPGGVVIAAQVWAGEWVSAADTTGLTVIGMSHESFEACRNSSRYQRVLKYYADMDMHLLLTDADADAWAARAGMTNVGAMPNPLMTVPKTMPTLDEKTVVSLRRLSHDKGIDMLLEAWALIGPQYPDWSLKIYGAGPDEAELREQARELGLDDNQILVGKTDNIDAALSAASIYALPSREEGFPIAIMEAMAYGLPTVAFDCAPGIRELIDDEVSGGLVVTAGNVPGMAAALERLMKDKDLRVRLGEAGRESVQRFTPDSIVDRWEALFALLDR